MHTGVPIPSLLAQTFDGSFLPIIMVIMGVLFVMGIFMVVARQYKRCPSNKILVVYGRVSGGRSSKTIHGGGTFVWPLIQNYSYLALDPMQIEIPLKGALSVENIRVNVPSVFTVAIGTTSHIMENAAIRLLGLNSNQIAHQAADIIFGQLRQVIASLPIEQINRDRDTFLHRIQESIEPELNKIGLVLINVNITDITDGSGYIEALGKKAASEAIQQATIAVAEEEKRGAIGVASAIREKEIAVADANKLREIGTQEAEREKAVRVAEILKERSVAEEQARFEKEARVKEAEQSMRVTIANADALAVQGENTAKAEIVASEAQLKVKQAEAYLLAEAREREAAAEVAAREALARAKAAEAEAAKVEAQKRAELEAPARAKKATTIVEAEAEAERERILAEGRARAALIEAEAAAKASYIDLEAQARGEYETLAKKAEGLREIVQSCGGVQGAFQLLMLEHIDKLAETAASAIANIRFDKVTVWDSGNGEKGGGGAAGFLRSLGQAVPPLHDVIRNLGGVELPSFFGRIVPNGVDAGSEEKASTDAALTSGGEANRATPSIPPVPPTDKPPRRES